MKLDQFAIVTEPHLAVSSHTPLPTPEEVRSWWDRFGMLPNIRAHSEMVTRVALQVADWLVESGIALNRRAVEVGALAHDIAKTPCLGTDKLHALEGEKILDSLGYPEIGYIVRLHVYLPDGHPLDECMVVNYADKRVKHDQVVDLAERWDYIFERYSQGDPERIARLKWGRERAFAVERRIFEQIGPGHHPRDILALGRAPS